MGLITTIKKVFFEKERLIYQARINDLFTYKKILIEARDNATKELKELHEKYDKLLIRHERLKSKKHYILTGSYKTK